MADAMHQVLKLSWRDEAAKICVFISDAPPHGLSASCGDGFPNGKFYLSLFVVQCMKMHLEIEMTHVGTCRSQSISILDRAKYALYTN